MQYLFFFSFNLNVKYLLYIKLICLNNTKDTNPKIINIKNIGFKKILSKGLIDSTEYFPKSILSI